MVSLIQNKISLYLCMYQCHLYNFVLQKYQLRCFCNLQNFVICCVCLINNNYVYSTVVIILPPSTMAMLENQTPKLSRMETCGEHSYTYMYICTCTCMCMHTVVTWCLLGCMRYMVECTPINM